MLNPNSPYLSERLVARLSPLRRSNLMRRLAEHAIRADEGRNAWAIRTHNEPTPHADRRWAILGRLSAMTA